MIGTAMAATISLGQYIRALGPVFEKLLPLALSIGRHIGAGRLTSVVMGVTLWPSNSAT